MTITQADIPFLRDAGRLGEYAVVYRVYRQQMGGGFGDQAKHPYAWGVLVYVDTQVARIYSARGLPREWTDLTRLEKWMREQGFWYWWMRNDLEPLHDVASEQDDDATDAAGDDAGNDAGNDAGDDQADAGDDEAAAGEDRPAPESEIMPLPSHLFNFSHDASD